MIMGLGLVFCSGKPGPKDVVFDFIRAVYDSDSTKIVKILDVDAYNRMHMVEMSPEDIKDDFAEVEVSFIDRSTNVLTFTKIQLRKQPDGSWRIVYFK
jgi:hypothetical protein